MDTNCKKDTRPIMVSINCITYNHEKYIRDTLEGFVMQKTNFRFEAIVHDDASTDGTAAIIREYAEKYPDIIKPIFETQNQYSKHDGSLGRIMKEHTKYSKYVAWCEGDDFWIDPLKLQKQVNVMEANPDASFVHTGFNVVDSEGTVLIDEKFENLKARSHSGIALFDLLVNMNKIMTLTFMARQDVNSCCPNNYYDYGLFLVAARMGKCIYLPDITSSYRINPHSIMRTASKSLIIPRYNITYEQIYSLIHDDGKTADCIKSHPLFKSVIGFIICRNIFRNPVNKLSFFKLAFFSPTVLFYVIKGFYIKIFTETKFRFSVAKI